MRGLRTAVVCAAVGVAALPLLASTNASAYDSSADPNVTAMFGSFATLTATTKHQNSHIEKVINRAASLAQRTDAARTADFPFTETRISIPEAFGSRLQPALIGAEDRGELPLTLALLAQHREGTNASELDAYTTWKSAQDLKELFKEPRPYCSIPSIVRAQPPTAPSGHRLYIRDCAHPGKDFSFPSGHTRSAYVEGIALATFLPELAPQILARTAQVANNRVVLGVHYPLDVIAGRALAIRIVAARYRDPVWHARLEAARSELRTVLAKECGATIASCVASQTPFMPTAAAAKLSRDYLTYRCVSPRYCVTPTSGFTPIGPTDIALTPPTDATSLIADTFPNRSSAQLDKILTSTAIGSGYPLDAEGEDSADAGWTRIDLARALTAPGAAPASTVAANPDDGSNLLVVGVAAGGVLVFVGGCAALLRRRTNRSDNGSGRHRSR